MKRFFPIVLFTMIFASPTLAQQTTSGGGPDLPVQSPGKGSGTLKDTTQHTTFDNGVVVSGSVDKGGKPNGGAGSGGTHGGSGGASYEGE